ncbi:hypothetical protein JOC24_004012 [Streptomyces sp. HB132]|nr:hypothetical protein [Streptomyces sp. HB132]
MSTLGILSEDEQLIVSTVHDFVDEDTKPVARELDHTDTRPEALIEQMRNSASSASPSRRGAAAHRFRRPATSRRRSALVRHASRPPLGVTLPYALIAELRLRVEVLPSPAARRSRIPQVS